LFYATFFASFAGLARTGESFDCNCQLVVYETERPKLVVTELDI